MDDSYVCKYCGKSFRRESTLAAHMCEPKRRWQQEKETGVQLGFRAWLRFYELSQGSAKTKTYADFVESTYYSAFVKFGQVMVQLRAVNPAAFTDHVIKSNKKLDHWTKDAVYDEYLFEYLRKEHPNDALERSFMEMQRWADETGDSFNNCFRKAAPNKICQMITNGRISPWVLFNSSSGVDFLDTLNEEQIAMIYRYIDPDFWPRKFKDYVADTEYIKEACRLGGV